MNDQFLKNYRKSPSHELIRELFVRLDIHPAQQSARSNPRIRMLGIGAAAAALSLALIFMISPAVRAQVGDWVNLIGGILIHETADFPGGNGPVSVAPSNSMNLDEAREQLPFTIDLPNWVPEGCELQSEVTITRFEGMATIVEMSWKTPGQSGLWLTIQKRLEGNPESWLVGMDSSQEITINGHPAVLVRGGWNADTRRWDDLNALLTVYWQHDEQLYILKGIGGEFSVDELIKIAESIQ